MPNNTISTLIKSATSQLNSTSDTARLDAELLLCHTIKKERSYVFTWPDYALNHTQAKIFNDLLKQRLKGLPIAYLIGYREFWTLKLNVNADTLIPRPETELLVETALNKMLINKPMSVLDLGTGTGAIALSIASEQPSSKVLAVDVSADALAVAQQNSIDNHIHNVKFLKSNWFDQISNQEFDLILSNPPYIEEDDPHINQGDVRYEPRLALTSGTDGFDDIRFIISHSKKRLKHKGWLMFEHGYQQATLSQQLMVQAGYQEVESLKDFAGHERVTIGCKY